MSDDVDDLVRRAMATLDAPEGYFDTLADRTLARLDEAPAELLADEAVGEAAVIGEARDEDSGLQDIRSLASEAKARLRRSSQEAIARGPASSSAWRAVAVADPQRVSQPALGATAASETTDRSSAAGAARGAAGDARGATAIDDLAAARALRVAPPTATPPVPVKPRRAMFAAAGLAVAVAAGALIFVSTTRKDAGAPMPEAQRVARAPALPAPSPPAPVAVAPKDAVTDLDRAADPTTRTNTAAGSAAHGDNATANAKPVRIAKTKGGNLGKLEAPRADEPVGKLEAPRADEPVAKPAPTKPEATNAAQGSDEPSFDELLKEAKIAPAKAAAKKLAKQGLAADDIRRGMASVAPAAKRCYAGTAGTASVRVTVAPSGQIAKVTITGSFAGTPVAACVERAVRAAAFPAWDGGPQTFGSSYLLSD